MRNKRALGWFLWGLGTQLQIVASLSFTELFVFAAAPFVFLREQVYMKKNGIMPFFYLSLALVGGCVVACVANHTQPMSALRGLAVCCLMPCSIVVGHWMIRKNMAELKWLFIGGALSGVICTFVFQKTVEVFGSSGMTEGVASAEDIMSGATYWIHRLNAFVTLPAKGWYLSCPIIYCVCAPLFMAGFSLLTSVSGRGSAARAIASAVMVLIGGKKRESIRKRVCRHFWTLMIAGMICAFAVKQGYQIAATNGWLGEAARVKYEAQTKGNKSTMALLLGGRMASFCGLIACVDNPIIGFGPWAQDTYGYTGEFLARYADAEDYQNYLKSIAYANEQGIARRNLIPCHAVVTQLWLWYGICGLLFCLYVFFVLLRYLKEDCWAVPQWYFWIAASIPGTFWDMCFNPLTNRIGISIMIIACLFARSVRKGSFELPMEMVIEIQRTETKR